MTEAEFKSLDELLAKYIVKKEDLEWVTPQVIALEQRAFRRGFLAGAQETINYITCGVSSEKVDDWVYGDLQDWAAEEGKITHYPEIK